MNTKNSNNPFARLPSVDTILARPDIASLQDRFPRPLVLTAVRHVLTRLRKALQEQPETDIEITAAEVEATCRDMRTGTLRRVINATGVVVHTNLGRAPLPSLALERLADISSGYSNLEYDLAAGKRGSRHGHAVSRLKEILGVEDALVVNNNAAAVFLALSGLAKGSEVIVSRGELVEIGGSFRIPDVMTQSGARLREVGTTNKTRIQDYRDAVTDETALLLKVHRSNFEMVGFAEEASVEELAALGEELQIPTMMDLGSGCFEDAYASFDEGRFPEQGVRRVLDAGIQLVTFSGDKLLGGPQAGILAGSGTLIDRLRRHPFMRVVRPGKMTFAVLDAVLDAYQWGQADSHVPVVRMLCESPDQVRRRAEQLLALLDPPGGDIQMEIVETSARVGGGAQPLLAIPSAGIRIRSNAAGPDKITAALRETEPPVVGRVADEAVILDVRTVQPWELQDLASCIQSAWTALSRA